MKPLCMISTFIPSLVYTVSGTLCITAHPLLLSFGPSLLETLVAWKQQKRRPPIASTQSGSYSLSVKYNS